MFVLQQLDEVHNNMCRIVCTEWWGTAYAGRTSVANGKSTVDPTKPHTVALRVHYQNGKRASLRNRRRWKLTNNHFPTHSCVQLVTMCSICCFLISLSCSVLNARMAYTLYHTICLYSIQCAFHCEPQSGTGLTLSARMKALRIANEPHWTRKGLLSCRRWASANKS